MPQPASSAVDVATSTILTAARGIRRGDTTSEALTRACLDRVASHQHLNAFTTVFVERAVADAQRADAELRRGVDRGSLHGIPISLKDLFDVEGTTTTAGSRVFEGTIASRDATIVSRLREAGAIFVGKCNLHEFAFGTTSEDSAFGPVRHPLDASRSAGGSSGGSAVAVATGMSLGSIGTDTGGSVRIPAAICGLVGLKPRFDELPSRGVVPLSRSLDHVGPIARSVDDAQLLFHVMRGDSLGTPTPPAATLRWRFGVPRPYFLDILDDEVRQGFNDVVARLRAAGAAVDDVTIPHADVIGAVYFHISIPEAVAYHAPMLEQRPQGYTPNVRLRLEAGRYLLAEDYVRAQRGQALLRREVDAALAGVDALLLPTVAIPAPRIGEGEVQVGGRTQLVRSMMLRLTQLFNITGHPAITLPAGATQAGLPWGVQMVGQQGAGELLRLAADCEPRLGAAWISS